MCKNQKNQKVEDKLWKNINNKLFIDPQNLPDLQYLLKEIN